MRSDKYILDAHGDPQVCEDLFTWTHWMETHRGLLHVADTRFGAVRVSTVFLGLDHGFGAFAEALGWEPGPPILYESMVFGGPLDGEQWRYATRAEADAGHTALCIAVTEAADHPSPIAAGDPSGDANTGKPTTRD